MPIAETEVARHVVEWLAADGWAVHEEVAVGSGVADIIALREQVGFRLPLIRRIEVKTALSVELVAQAVEARRSLCSHTVEVAIPEAKRSQRISTGQRYLLEQLQHHQVGMLRVRLEEPESWARDQSRVVVDDHLRPGLSRALDQKPNGWGRRDRAAWLSSLKRTAAFCAEHRNIVPAGTNRGGFWTPYKGTMWYVREFLKKRGDAGATLGEIMGELTGKHHYRTDALTRRAVPTNLDLYESEWCRIDRSGKQTVYRLREVAHG